MNVLVANATTRDREIIAEFLAPNASVVALENSAPEQNWPLAVVFLPDLEGGAEVVRDVRRELGPSPVLIGICREGSHDPSDVIEAGLDDLCDSIDAFLLRYPFFASRLRVRAQRHLRLEAILENTVDSIIVIDDQGIIQSANRAVFHVFGYLESELIGRNVSILMPEPYKAEHDGYLERYTRSGVPRIVGIGRELVGLKANGETFPMELAVSEVKLDGYSLFTGLIRDISERRRLETEILRAAEEERRRIGQDLHDGLGQMLTGIGLIAKRVGRTLRETGSELAGDVEEVAELIRDADEQARLLARGLVPVVVDENGLVAALADLCKKAERLFGGQCVFKSSGEAFLKDPTKGANLYRIAQEAVSNAFKHGRADRVVVTLRSGPHKLTLQVLDNGVGFPEMLEAERGMGVRIMHYRASVVGGRLSIRQAIEGGTLVSCDIPTITLR
ncbi:PAS domain S-box protein [Rhodothermus sp. AH-315-K08]|nr:PAS domain S-box protein [Rhodothermus sp. AH-315-K08]